VNLGNEVIVKDPEILGGISPVFCAVRVFLFRRDYLEGGQALSEFVDDFPTVTPEPPSQHWNSRSQAGDANWS
jgi:hypothetical protein